MSKKVVIGVVVILVLLVGGFFIFSGDSDGVSDGGNEDIGGGEDLSEYVELGDSEDVFNEIDSALEFVGD